MTNEALMQAFKWYFIAFFVVVGASCFLISSDTGSNKLILAGILSFGVVYVMTSFWQNANNKVFVIGIILFLCVSQIPFSGMQYIGPYVYMYTGFDLRTVNSYFLWGVLEGVIGIPVMTYVFKKYD